MRRVMMNRTSVPLGRIATKILQGIRPKIVYQAGCELRASSCEQTDVGVCSQLVARSSKLIGKGRRFAAGGDSEGQAPARKLRGR